MTEVAFDVRLEEWEDSNGLRFRVRRSEWPVSKANVGMDGGKRQKMLALGS